MKKKVCYKKFKGDFWFNVDTALAEAADFASSIGEDRLISITPTHGAHFVVWYWSD